jgi:4-amino-4-deoxy-L-arabinose transferase-like glycosyltransferase
MRFSLTILPGALGKVVIMQQWSRRQSFLISRGFLVALGVFSVLFNLSVTGLVTGFSSFEPEGDEAEYFELASNLASRFQFTCEKCPDLMYRTPVYPALLALVFAITGPSVAVAKVVNCCLGGLTPVALAVLGRLLFDPVRGGLAGLLACLTPSLFSVNATLYSETLATLAFLWLNVFLVAALRQAGPDVQGHLRFVPWHWLALGAGLGLLMLIKPQFVFFLPFLALAGLWHFWNHPGFFGRLSLAVLLTFCLTMSPWWLRNALVSGGYFIPLSTSGGRTLLDGNNPAIAHMSPRFIKFRAPTGSPGSVPANSCQTCGITPWWISRCCPR